MAVRPIILKGPGKPKRKWSSQLQGGPPNPVAPFFSVPGQTEERPSTVIWPSQVSGSTPPVIPIINGGPQLYDFTQQSSLTQPAYNASSSVVPAEFVWGTHAVATHVAEALKSSVFRSVAAAVVVAAAVPALIFAPQQAYADVNQSFIEAPLVSGATPRTIPRVSIPPQVDLTQQGWISEPQSARQGAVPPLTQGGPQNDPSQLAAKLTPAQPAPTVSNPVTSFFAVPPQAEERPTRSVWPSQVSGNTPPVIAQLRGGPQLVDLTQQSNLTQPSVVPPLVSYAVSPLYAAPQLADFTQQGWIKGAAPVRQGGVPDRNWASQADPSQIAAQVFPSVVTPPIFIGDVPPLVLAGQPQANTDQIPAVVWTPLVFGEPPPEPAFEIIIGGDDAPRKKKKRRKSSIEELNDLLDRVVEENTPPAPASKKALKQITDAITDQDDDDDEEALIALT